MMWLALLFTAAFSLSTVVLWPRKNTLEFLTKTCTPDVQTSRRAIDIRTLTEQPLLTYIKVGFSHLNDTLGKYVYLALTVYTTLIIASSLWLHDVLPRFPLYVLFPLLLCTTTVFSVMALKHIQRKRFEASFPDALRTLTGAVTSGESLHQAIVFVGSTLDNLVGREFRNMGQKLSLGQSMGDVLMCSSQRFPYPVFLFFVLTLRTNTCRGGQLKSLFKNLERVMLNNQTLQKKMKALTSEVRMSAKIIGALPPGFFLFMKYVSPDNFDFVMHHPAGQVILVYVVGSEILGMLIIWWLMRQVRG